MCGGVEARAHRESRRHVPPAVAAPAACRTWRREAAVRRDATGRGFTLVEMGVVLAIVAIVAALGVTSLERAKPRSRFATSATELHALLRNARLNALATG